MRKEDTGVIDLTVRLGFYCATMLMRMPIRKIATEIFGSNQLMKHARILKKHKWIPCASVRRWRREETKKRFSEREIPSAHGAPGERV